ncbi:putative adhesin [Hahella ganghwensis]|uniref:putative adhesin n=1 Tax=Hahella ganghwensis TaxID=286420 RepID=UPI0012F879F2|nr:hypothetical protein [Hahella ganghwensis]
MADEFAKDIFGRWVGKDKVDRLHWNRSFINRELVEAYDVGAEALDTIADLIVGLWDIIKFTVKVVGEGIELVFDVSVAVAQFQQKLLSGDIDGVKKDLQALGIEVADSLDSAEKLIAKAKEGYLIFQQLVNDRATERLIMDYLESLWETIPYRDSRTIGVRIVAEVGVEVLLALATGGAGNIARRAAHAGAKGAKMVKATRIGPFSVAAIDLMVDLARELRAAQKVRRSYNKKWLNGEVGIESLPPQPRHVEPPLSSRTKSSEQTSLIGDDSSVPTTKDASDGLRTNNGSYWAESDFGPIIKTPEPDPLDIDHLESGHSFANTVTEGGTGRALAGHGTFFTPDGNIIVPEGTSITLPKPGISILDKTGRYIENGDWVGLGNAARNNERVARDIEGMATWLPGAEIPNYTLSKPTDLNIYSRSTSTAKATNLDKILSPDMGCVDWAACTAFFEY